MSTIFSGTSRFSADFGSVIERSVGIASLALTQMQQARLKSDNEIKALSNLQIEVEKIQSTISTLESSVSGNPMQATSSNTSLLKVTAGTAVAAGSFKVNVVGLGSYSTAVGKTNGHPVTSDPNAAGWLDGSITQLTLRTVDHNGITPVEKDVTIDLNGATSLQDVVDRINNTSGAEAKAAIVNVSATSTPNYTITLQSSKLGKIGLQLKQGAPPPVDSSGDMLDVNENDGASSLLGTRAEYKVNGVSVMNESRSVTLAPGLTADLVKADAGQEITVEIKQNTSAVKSAVRSFASAYTTLMGELDKMAGANGALKGNAIVGSIRNQLRSAITQNFAGTLGNMAAVGLEFQKDGSLSLNESVFDQATAGDYSKLKNLIGSAAEGGLTRALDTALKTITTPQGGGFLNTTVTSLKSSLAAEDKRIAAETDRIENLTKDLQERMAKADAMIAQLEQQASYFNNMFESMRANQRSMS